MPDNWIEYAVEHGVAALFANDDFQTLLFKREDSSSVNGPDRKQIKNPMLNIREVSLCNCLLSEY